MNIVLALLLFSFIIILYWVITELFTFFFRLTGLPDAIFLKPGYPIGQLVFFETSEVAKPYDGKYNGQVEATGSRMYLDTMKGV